MSDIMEAIKEALRHEYERGARDGLNVGYAHGYSNARYVRGSADYKEKQAWQAFWCQDFPDGFSPVIAYIDASRAISRDCIFFTNSDNSEPATVKPLGALYEFLRSPEAVAVCDAAKRYDARQAEGEK